MQLSIVFYDADSGYEIEGLNFPNIASAPRIGEEIHYWQDGTSDGPRDSGDRMDFLVRRIRHDLRYVPGRGGTQPVHVQTIEVFVSQLKP